MPVGLLVSLGVTASVGVASTPSAGAEVPTNLVVDPELAHGTAAWTTVPGAGLSLVAGHSGHRAVRLTNHTDRALTLNLNDRANTVTSTRAGTRYAASAWIRTSAPGTSVATREGEWSGSGTRGAEQSAAWLPDSAWHLVKVTYAAVRSGSTIDLNVVGWQVPAGQSIDVSQPSLTVVGAAPAGDPPPPAPTATAPPKAPTGYKLVFSDGFNGSALNAAKWHVRNNSWASNEQSIVTSRRKNVFLANGAVTLRARREDYSTHGTSRHYTSAYLDTIGRHSWRYGRFVMRAKLPSTVGSWPAFWLRADHGPGEVDVMEAVGGVRSFVAQTVHQSTDGGQARLTHGVHSFRGGSPTSAWHTYGVTVTRARISWDIDGTRVFTASASSAPWITRTFDDRLNIRINLQVGGSMPASFGKQVGAASTFPADYSIDYVRVYQRR